MAFFRLLGIGGTAGLAVGIVLALLLVIQKGETRHWRKVAERQSELAQQFKAELDRISSEKNEQRVITRDRLRTVTKIVRAGENEAQRIERTKVEGGKCATPGIIMESDI